MCCIIYILNWKTHFYSSAIISISCKMFCSVSHTIKVVVRYLNISVYSRVRVCDVENSRNEMWHWTNNEIAVAVESWLSARWTHGLIAQSVRASKWNSVVVGSHPMQANFQTVPPHAPPTALIWQTTFYGHN